MLRFAFVKRIPSSPLFYSTTRGLATSVKVPKTQKAIIFYKHGGPLEYKDIPVQQPGPNDILVNIKYTGVCNSDYHLWKGDWDFPTELPLVLGHEGAGVVVAKGENVKNFEIGDYAGVKWLNSTCKSCEFCESGLESNCAEQKNSGYNAPGTYQQYAVADAIQAAKIPKDVSLPEVAPILCAGITVYKGLKKSDVKPGEWITIIGAGGGLGTLAVQYAKALGFKVIGIDGSHKREHVFAKGATEFIAHDEVESLKDEVFNITKSGSHAVLNVSNSVSAINEAVNFLRPSGTLILIGLPKGHEKVESDINTHVLNCYTIRGSCVGNRADTREAIEFLQRGIVESPVKVAGLSEAPEIFKLMEQRKILGRYVLDTSR